MNLRTREETRENQAFLGTNPQNMVQILLYEMLNTCFLRDTAAVFAQPVNENQSNLSEN